MSFHDTPKQLSNLTPMSDSQRRLWMWRQVYGDKGEWNLVHGLRIRGMLDHTALESALNAIVTRHEALRTHFDEVDSVQVQVVEASRSIDFQHSDISMLPEPARADFISESLTNETLNSFNLCVGPLLRASLLRLSPTDHIFIRSIHHIVYDAWSHGIFNTELFRLYSAFRAGVDNPLDSLPLQYREFTNWEVARKREPNFGEGLTFWRHHLAGAPRVLDVFSKHHVRRPQSFKAGVCVGAVTHELLSVLRSIAKRTCCSLYVIMLAVFSILIARRSRKKDFVIGTPFANRFDRRLEQLIGGFSQVLPMRITLDENLQSETLIANVRRTWLQNLKYSYVPLMSIFDALPVHWDQLYSPLFQVVLAMQNAPRVDDGLDGLELDYVQPTTFRVRYDLEVHLMERSDRIDVFWLYSSDLFERQEAEQMMQEYLSLLGRFVEGSDTVGSFLGE